MDEDSATSIGICIRGFEDTSGILGTIGLCCSQVFVDLAVEVAQLSPCWLMVLSKFT